MVSSIQGLAPITNPLNSVLIEKKLINVDQKFIQLVCLAEGLPRTEVIESGRNYWRGVCRSLIFRFPDDLEILKLDVRSYVDRSKGIIQIRSETVIICLMHRATKINIIILLNIYFT